MNYVLGVAAMGLCAARRQGRVTCVVGERGDGKEDAEAFICSLGRAINRAEVDDDIAPWLQ